MRGLDGGLGHPPDKGLVWGQNPVDHPGRCIAALQELIKWLQAVRTFTPLGEISPLNFLQKS